MGGLAATLHLDGHGCPVQRALPSNCTLHHLAPGNPGPPFGFGEGQFPDAWVRLASTPRGELLEGTEWMCSDCPLARLPAGVKPLRASVNAQGIRVDVIAKDNEVLQEAVSVLRAGGATVRVLRSSGRAGMALSSGAFVDLGSLTGRQLEIMQTAVRMGYLDAQRGASILELAERVGCSGPTAHEHLRKATWKVLDSLFRQGRPPSLATTSEEFSLNLGPGLLRPAVEEEVQGP